MVSCVSAVFFLVSGVLAGDAVEVIPREAWGARPQSGACLPHEISAITVHHTDWDFTRVHHTPRRLRKRQLTHQRTRRWIDLAYHLVIDHAGNVYEGRDQACVGDTATEYDPTGHLLIVLDGDFEDQQPTLAAFERLTQVVAWASDHYDVVPEHIRGHRELADTPCPGDFLFRYLEDGTLRARAGVLRAASAPTLTEVSIEEGQGRVRALRD